MGILSCTTGRRRWPCPGAPPKLLPSAVLINHHIKHHFYCFPLGKKSTSITPRESRKMAAMIFRVGFWAYPYRGGFSPLEIPWMLSRSLSRPYCWMQVSSTVTTRRKNSPHSTSESSRNAFEVSTLLWRWNGVGNLGTHLAETFFRANSSCKMFPNCTLLMPTDPAICQILIFLPLITRFLMAATFSSLFAVFGLTYRGHHPGTPCP